MWQLVKGELFREFKNGPAGGHFYSVAHEFFVPNIDSEGGVLGFQFKTRERPVYRFLQAPTHETNLCWLAPNLIVPHDQLVGKLYQDLLNGVLKVFKNL